MEEKVMYVSLKELKRQPGRFVSMASDGNKIVVTERGKPKAQIIPLEPKAKSKEAEMAEREEAEKKFFGMWADREDMQDVDAYLRNLRKGRSFE